MSHDVILDEFIQHRPALRQVAQAVATELTEALAQRGVMVQLIDSRL